MSEAELRRLMREEVDTLREWRHKFANDTAATLAEIEVRVSLMESAEREARSNRVAWTATVISLASIGLQALEHFK